MLFSTHCYISEVTIILKCGSDSEKYDIVITIAMGGTKNPDMSE